MGTGAIVGTFVFPVVGTAVGAGIGFVGGATLGSLAGGFLTEPAGSWLLGPSLTVTKEEQFAFGVLLGSPFGILAGTLGPAAYAYGGSLISYVYSKWTVRQPVSLADSLEQELVRPGGNLEGVLNAIEEELGGAAPTSQATSLEAVINAATKQGLEPGVSVGALPGQGDVILKNARGITTVIKQTGQIIITNSNGQIILNILPG